MVEKYFSMKKKTGETIDMVHEAAVPDHESLGWQVTGEWKHAETPDPWAAVEKALAQAIKKAKTAGSPENMAFRALNVSLVADGNKSRTTQAVLADVLEALRTSKDATQSDEIRTLLFGDTLPAPTPAE